MYSWPPYHATAAAVLAVFCLAWAVNAQTREEDASPAKLVVTVLDESQLPVQDAQVEIKVKDHLILATPTNETGRAEFSCIPGRNTAERVLGRSAPLVSPDSCARLQACPEPRAGATSRLSARPGANRKVRPNPIQPMNGHDGE